MPYRLKRWQWAVVAVVFPCYVVWAIFQVFGGIYLGVPPWTPAWLNNTKIPIERRFTLERRTLLRITGEIREGQVRIQIDGQPELTVLGQVNRLVTLEPGEHRLVFGNVDSYGWIQYRLE